jgi:hypothetical protein
MRQPALSGPGNEIPRERVEYVPAKLPGAIITREFGIPSRTFWPFPPWTSFWFGPPPLPGLFADPAKTDLVFFRTSSLLKSPFQVAVRPKWVMPRAHSALCAAAAAAKRNRVLRSDLKISFPIVLLLIARGWGWAVRVCALVAHTHFSGNHRFEGFGR